MSIRRVKEPRFPPLKAATDGGVSPGMVRVGTLMAVPGLLREFGVDPARVLAEFGLEPGHFEDPDNTIPFANEGRILSRCAALTRCPHFGLLTGQREGLSMFGAIGFLVQSAPDMRTALDLAVRHYRLHNPNAMIDLAERDSFATLRYAILQKGIEGSEHILDEAMAIAINVMRTLCGQKWLPIEVRFAHASPPELAPFRKFFRAPLRFDAHETALVFARHWLDPAPAGADPLLNKMMAQRVNEMESHSSEVLVSVIISRMLPSLLAVQGASLAAVAKRVGLGERTLNRRLAVEGTSFMQLREQARHTLARQLLENTRMPANEIAIHLGYANTSALTRAFHRWTGMGPAQWRASRRRTSLKRSRSSGRD